MTATYVCPFDWCTSDHTDKYDDFDGEGRFHVGETVSFKLPDDPGATWNRDDFEYELRCWTAADGSRDFRLATFDAALTPDEVRAYAAWLVEHAAEVEAIMEAGSLYRHEPTAEEAS